MSAGMLDAPPGRAGSLVLRVLPLRPLSPRRAGYLHDEPSYSDSDRANAHAHQRATQQGRPIALGVADGEANADRA